MGNHSIKEKSKLEENENPTVQQMDWGPYNETTSDPNLFVVLYDFQPDEENQLNVKKGEKVHVQVWDQSKDWCTVTNKNKSGYVPTKYLAPWTSLDKYPWFHGSISRSAAEYILRSEVEGTFLVRESATCPDQFCISLKSDCMIIHYKVTEDKGNFYLTSEKTYNSLPELIKGLSSDTLSGLPILLSYFVPKKHKPTIYEVCPGIPDKWELDRSELELMEKLGSGQYGDVYKARLVNIKKLAAIKTLKEAISAEGFVKEAAIMKSMKHPNLIQLLGVCSKRIPFYIIMEYMSNGNLLDFLKSNSRSELTPTVLLYMATQIASAMAYLESKNFIHRDLAARNCLVGDDHLVKVADFGLARVVSEETYTSQSSSLLPIKWTAPEGLAFNVFSTKSDVWAFGILLFEIVTYGKIPYPTISMVDVYSFLEQGKRMECPPNCPQDIYELMKKCWEWDADKRPTFKEIRYELENISYSNKEGSNSQHTLPSTRKHDGKLTLGRNQIPEVTTNILHPSKIIKKSNSFGEPIISPTSGNVPTMTYKNELLQKISQSESFNVMKPNLLIPAKNELVKSKPQFTKPAIPPPLVPVHPKPKKITKPLEAPPLPPTKPPKLEIQSPSRIATKGLASPPSIPLKPWITNKTTDTKNSNKPNLPSKTLTS